MRKKINSNFPFFALVLIWAPGLEISEQAWQLFKAMPEREGWGVNLVTHVHLGGEFGRPSPPTPHGRVIREMLET